MVRRPIPGRTRACLVTSGFLAAAVAGALPAAAGPSATAGSTCAGPVPGIAYQGRLRNALASGRDTWGEALLSAPQGPTLAAARRYLAPLLLARGPRQTPLTDSGAYYVAMGQPEGPQGAGTVALHVTDGSQVIAQRVGGRALTISVGPGGRERYGSCPTRLQPASLANGYLPILRTGYVDRAGVVYRQESFAARISQTRSLVSFVRVEADARTSKRGVVVRFRPSGAGLRLTGSTLVRGRNAELAFMPGGAVSPSGVTYRVAAGTKRAVVVAWLATPDALRPIDLDDETYGEARSATADYWQERLAQGMQVSVPEPEVENGLRAHLVQAMTLTWRYSIGNPYEQFSFPESVDAARVMDEYGLPLVARSMLRTSLTRDEQRYRNWKRGQRMAVLAAHYRLSGDATTVRQFTPRLRGWVADFARQLAAPGRPGLEQSLLARERYSSDIPDRVYGLHSQAVAWEGLRAMAGVWHELGERELAVHSSSLAERLGRGIRRAVAASQRRLGDGSLFVPVSLLAREQPYALVVQERLGSYWNLVMPFALASGIFPPGSPQARGVQRYIELHGGRLLGVVRSGAYALYGRDAYPASGVNHVYNLSVSRFLADEDRPDDLVLSLYGALASSLTRGTFVSGEAASVTPFRGTSYRGMYLPPNAGSGAAFLEAVRQLLVHETRDRDGRPLGLELAFSTPRAWLAPGRRISVREAPTSFGHVSYSIATGGDAVTVSLALPERRPRSVRLRLRLPRGTSLGRVEVGGAPFGSIDRATSTLDLGGRRGTLEIVAHYKRPA